MRAGGARACERGERADARRGDGGWRTGAGREVCVRVGGQPRTSLRRRTGGPRRENAERAVNSRSDTTRRVLEAPRPAHTLRDPLPPVRATCRRAAARRWPRRRLADQCTAQCTDQFATGRSRDGPVARSKSVSDGRDVRPGPARFKGSAHSANAHSPRMKPGHPLRPSQSQRAQRATQRRIGRASTASPINPPRHPDHGEPASPAARPIPRPSPQSPPRPRRQVHAAGRNPSPVRSRITTQNARMPRSLPPFCGCSRAWCRRSPAC